MAMHGFPSTAINERFVPGYMYFDCSKDRATCGCGNKQMYPKFTLVMISGVIFEPATLNCANFFLLVTAIQQS